MPPRVHFECCQPILRVENMQASLRFYVDALGFENAEWGSDDFTSISRDGASIYLSLGDQGRGGAWVWTMSVNYEHNSPLPGSRFVWNRTTFLGRSKCKSKILTATSSVSDPNPND